MRFALVLVLLLPAVASAEEPPPFRVRMPSGYTQPTDRQLERAVNTELLDNLVRQRVERENDQFMQPYQSQQIDRTTPMGAAISQAFENHRVDSEVSKAIRDAARPRR